VSSLPERPNLGHLRKQAKELLRQYRADDPAALAAFRQYLPAAKDKSATALSSVPLGLRDAQSCITNSLTLRASSLIFSATATVFLSN
jgi:hypothetical protein